MRVRKTTVGIAVTMGLLLAVPYAVWVMRLGPRQDYSSISQCCQMPPHTITYTAGIHALLAKSVCIETFTLIKSMLALPKKHTHFKQIRR